jgi:hypothetical protein
MLIFKRSPKKAIPCLPNYCVRVRTGCSSSILLRPGENEIFEYRLWWFI